MNHLKFGAGILALAVLGFMIFKFSMIAINIIGGVVVYFLLAHFLDFLERQGASEQQSILVLILMLVSAVLAFILYVSIPFVEQLTAFSSELPVLMNKAEVLMKDYQQSFPFITQAAESAQKWLASGAESFFSMLGPVMTSFLTIPIIAAVLLASRKTLRKSLFEQVPNEYFEVTVTMANEIIQHVQDYVWAKGAELFVMILIYAAGFYIIDLPHWLLFAIAGGVLNVIPYLGPLLTIPVLAVPSLLGGGLHLFAAAMIVLIIAQLIDNIVLQTWLMSALVDVHPLIVVVITLLGGELLGTLGMIIAIPAYVITKIILAGLYNYLQAMQRHETLLYDEKRQEESKTHNQEHQVSANIF